MRASEVEIGRTYAVRVSGDVVPVRIVREEEVNGRRRWRGINLRTQREVTIRSPQRLRHEVQLVNGRWRVAGGA